MIRKTALLTGTAGASVEPFAHDDSPSKAA